MVDVEKVREFYFNPPAEVEPRIPTREEFYARYERERVESCLLRGGDPEKEGLGEHGRLIGGRGRPLTVFTEDPERVLGCAPLPLAWYDYPAAREPWPPEGGVAGAHEFLGFLSAKYLAGLRDRPTGAGLERLFRAKTLTWLQSYWLRHIFLCIRADQFSCLLVGAGLSVYEVARAVHNSGTHRAPIAIWLEDLALRPGDLARVGEGEWRKLRRAKEQAWARTGARLPFRSG